MWKHWKAILVFAVLGFAITGCFYALNTYHDYTKPLGPLDSVFGVANFILCPPIVLFIGCIDCEYGTPAGLEVNLLTVGILNSLLYGTIAMACYWLKERKRSKAKLLHRQGPENRRR